MKSVKGGQECLDVVQRGDDYAGEMRLDVRFEVRGDVECRQRLVAQSECFPFHFLSFLSANGTRQTFSDDFQVLP
jgi:hypothetical protein